MTDDPYSPRVAGPAARVIERKLPESVAAAVLEFITGTLPHHPHRARRHCSPLKGTCSALRGAFRISYEIDEAHHRVIALRIKHRADVYRPH